MSKLLNIKLYSINAKVVVSLFILALFLLTILFALIIPKMQKDQYNQAIKEINQVLSITQEQVKLAGKAIQMQSSLEIEVNKKTLELELLKLKNKIKKENYNNKRVIQELQKSEISQLCNFAVKTKNSLYLSSNSEIFKNYKLKNYNQWEKYELQDLSRTYVYYKKYLFYTIKIDENTEISIYTKEAKLNQGHSVFEKNIKINVQKAFETTQNLHKGKTYLIWINSKYKDEDNKPLYTKDKKERKKKYTISNMSNVENISTGDLSAKEILKARNKPAISHLLNNKEALTWVRDLSKDKSDKYIFLLIKTLYKEDLVNQIDSSFLKILPAAIIALIFALIIGFYLFKRLFKNINSLTEELKTSLEEKETLLKEIHHRVKNNLALTIGLVKLQQAKIEDENTKKILKDIQERVYTMELLHRKLYESSNLNSINLKEYIINLVEDISKTYDYEEEVSLKFDIDEIETTIEKAMPCGLIINELISNAYKYAFKNNKNPKLFISMKKEDKNLLLIIKDNGKGIDENIDIYNCDSLGLKLVNSICTLQLHGKIQYQNQKGAIFKITFQNN